MCVHVHVCQGCRAFLSFAILALPVCGRRQQHWRISCAECSPASCVHVWCSFVVLTARHFSRTTVRCPIKGGIDWRLPAPEISRIFFSRRPPFFSYFVPEDELLLTSSEDELVLFGGRARPRYFCAATVLAVRPCWPRGPFCQQLIICSKNLAACLARLLVKIQPEIAKKIRALRRVFLTKP